MTSFVFVSNDFIVNPDTICSVEITGESTYKISFIDGKSYSCEILEKDISAKEFIKNTLIPKLIKSPYE